VHTALDVMSRAEQFGKLALDLTAEEMNPIIYN
jgi:hypothetical protein